MRSFNKQGSVYSIPFDYLSVEQGNEVVAVETVRFLRIQQWMRASGRSHTLPGRLVLGS